MFALYYTKKLDLALVVNLFTCVACRSAVYGSIIITNANGRVEMSFEMGALREAFATNNAPEVLLTTTFITANNA